MWGGRRSLEMFQLLPRTPALSAPPGEWPDSGAIGEGLGDMLPIPGEGGLVCPAVSPQSCWPTPPCPHSLPILPVNGASREMAGVVEDPA